MKRALICALGAASLFAALAAAQEGVSETKPAEGADVASEKEVDAANVPPGAEEACFYVRDIDDFDALSDGFVLVEGRGDENYLLTMWAGCFGLEGAIGIAVSSPMSRVCSTSGAEIRYRGLGRLETCRIRAVEAVESKEVAEALVEQRRAAQ
jgi:hypothetical protein